MPLDGAPEAVLGPQVTTAKARVYLNTQQDNLVSNVPTKVLLDVETYDPSAAFASSRFTAKVAGYYVALGAVTYVGASVHSGKQYRAIIRKNGVNAAMTIVLAAVVDYIAPQVHDIIHLDVDEYLELWAHQISGLNDVDVAAGADLTFLAIHLLSTD